MWAIVPTAASDSAGASTAHLGARSAVARLSRGAPGLKKWDSESSGQKSRCAPAFCETALSELLRSTCRSKRRLSPPHPPPLRCRRPSPRALAVLAAMSWPMTRSGSSWRGMGALPFRVCAGAIRISTKSQEHGTRAVSMPIYSQGEPLRCTALTTLGAANSRAQKQHVPL